MIDTIRDNVIHFFRCNYYRFVFWWKDVKDILYKRDLDKQQGFFCPTCKRQYK